MASNCPKTWNKLVHLLRMILREAGSENPAKDCALKSFIAQNLKKCRVTMFEVEAVAFVFTILQFCSLYRFACVRSSPADFNSKLSQGFPVALYHSFRFNTVIVFWLQTHNSFSAELSSQKRGLEYHAVHKTLTRTWTVTISMKK